MQNKTKTRNKETKKEKKRNKETETEKAGKTKNQKR